MRLFSSASASFVFQEIAADAVAEAFGLPDVDHPPAGILVQIHSRREGKLRYLVAEFHRRRAII
jgi:hypothetical protein